MMGEVDQQLWEIDDESLEQMSEGELDAFVQRQQELLDRVASRRGLAPGEGNGPPAHGDGSWNFELSPKLSRDHRDQVLNLLRGLMQVAQRWVNRVKSGDVPGTCQVPDVPCWMTDNDLETMPLVDLAAVVENQRAALKEMRDGLLERSAGVIDDLQGLTRIPLARGLSPRLRDHREELERWMGAAAHAAQLWVSRLSRR